jgi:hypothetical protein
MGEVSSEASNQPRTQGHVVKTTDTIIREPAPEDSPLKDDRIVFLGPDQNGVLLGVMAIETDQGFVIIHAMKMRRKYRPFLKGKQDA